MAMHRPDEIVNLCFHGIGEPGRRLEPEEDQYWLDCDRFERLLDVIEKRSEIRITFDDGNKSDLTHALPALKARGLPARFFVVAGRLDQPGSLSRSDVRVLADEGMIVGCHGLQHRPFRSLDDAQLEVELADAAQMIRAVCDQAVDEVACPFGSYDRRVLTAARRHGFTRVYTVDGGPARAGAWLQSRYTLRSDDTEQTIEDLVRSPGGSRWETALRTTKTAIKRLR
jgi:peptidoglycan/xylan/chitin deacetylase (PgdA/CDA1 family)